MVEHPRKWAGERLLRVTEIWNHPAVPIRRGYYTWRTWFRTGVKINGVTHRIPQKEIQGVPHTSVEALVELFAWVGPEDVPQVRERRSRK